MSHKYDFFSFENLSMTLAKKKIKTKILILSDLIVEKFCRPTTRKKLNELRIKS